MKPYATAHQDFDDNKAFQEEARNVARAPGTAIDLARTADMENPGRGSGTLNQNNTAISLSVIANQHASGRAVSAR